MKTKHFLITTEDGSAVAIVNCDCERELIRNAYKCVREQLDDNCIGEIISNIGWYTLITLNSKVSILSSMFNGIIYAKRIEIY